MTQQQLSYGERKMKGHVADVPNAPLAEETPEERAARTARNWDEIRKARINALKMRDPKAVAILDAEVASGRGTDFPHDAQFDEDPDADLGPLKMVGQQSRRAAPRASQADVRKSEPSMHLIEQGADEQAFESATKNFVAQTGGVLKDGQTHRQAVTEFSGVRDPKETAALAEARHAAETGELTYGDSVEYNAAKPLAAMAGFALKGPTGATVAEALVRATAIGYNINKALDNGLDEDRAVEIFVKEMTKGVAMDTLFNFGTPLLGQLIAKIPGLNRIADKLHAALQKRMPGPAPRPALRDESLETLKGKAATPERAKAVEELSKRVEGDFIPTPGQVEGKAGIAERALAKSFPTPFEEQEAALRAGAEKLRGEVVSPLSQAPGQPAIRPDAANIGDRIVELTEQTVKATKDRLRPIFKLANDQKVYSDFSKIHTIAQDALRRNADSGGGKLTEAEVGHLQKLVERYSPTNPQGQWASAEAALDFASTQKAMGRKLNADGEPTEYFSLILRDMTKEADRAFEKSLNSLGKGRVKTLLDAARTDYRRMNDVVYTGAIKQALKKGDVEPSDIGKMLWQNGKIGRIEDLDEMLALARREGVAGSATTSKLRRDVTRGFLQKAVQDVESAANWSKKLADPDRAATWAALTKGADGQALKDSMAVLEQAAQIATMRDTAKATPFLGIGLSRAAGGGLGISWVTGAFNPALVGAGLTIAGTMRLLAGAYTHSDTAVLNLVSKVLRSNSTATAASAKALQALLPELSKAAEKYNVTDLFLPAEQSEEQSDEQLGPR